MTALAADLGLWASLTYFVLGVAYVVVIIGGFVSNRNLKDPVTGLMVVDADLVPALDGLGSPRSTPCPSPLTSPRPTIPPLDASC